MKYSKAVIIMLAGACLLSGCGKDKEEQKQTVSQQQVVTPTPQPTPAIDPTGPIQVSEVFGNKFVDFDKEPTFYIAIECGNDEGYYAWFKHNQNSTITDEIYGYSYAQPAAEGQSEDDVVPAYGKNIELTTDSANTVLQHMPYHPDFNAFKNWYDKKHSELLQLYEQASNSEPQYDEEGNPITDLSVASAYSNQAAQLESKYEYYLNSRVRKTYGDVFKPEKNVLDIFEECYALSNFKPDGEYQGVCDIDFNGGYINADRYQLSSVDDAYIFIVYKDKVTGKVAEIDKYLATGGVDAPMLSKATIVYDINDESQPKMVVPDDTNFAKLTAEQMDSLLKQVTCISMPVLDDRYKVEGFNVLGMTSIRSMFDNRDDMITSELIKFGEDDGNFVNFDSVIWSSVDPEEKSVSCRFIYQDIPVSFTLTPVVLKDENGNKTDDSYEIQMKKTDSRNSNTWIDSYDELTGEQKNDVYTLAYENLDILKQFDMTPAGFEFDIDTYKKWYDSHIDGSKSLDKTLNENKNDDEKKSDDKQENSSDEDYEIPGDTKMKSDDSKEENKQ